MKYNEENNIIPQTIIKEIKEPIKLKEDYKQLKDKNLNLRIGWDGSL